MSHGIFFATTASLALLAAPAFAQAEFGPLLTPEELVAAQDSVDPLVIDIRAFDEAYAQGHIPGAVSAPYGLFRGPSDNPGMPPSEAQLTEVLRDLGVETDRPVVVVHQGSDVTDFGAAARVYWTLKSSGVTDLAILNGGVTAWEEAGLDLSTEIVDTPDSAIEVSFSTEWMATAEDVQAAIDADGGALLLDARPESFWNGEQAHPAAARPGTLPQSQYFVHDSWFSSGPVIVDAAAARALAEAEDFTGAGEIISFCNTGHWAATNWFALSELAGIEDVKLYPESMVGWSNAGYEMANVPGMLQNLRNQVFGNN
jgi:thiosulfate/3-mercaptopyruvate sulfurtransferase